MTPKDVMIECWTDTTKSLTIYQAGEVLATFQKGYTHQMLRTYIAGREVDASFAWLCAYELGRVRNWFDIPCQFTGGPSGTRDFTATLGAFVTDCFMREVFDGNEDGVWEAYREIQIKYSDDERVKIRC